MPFNLIILAGVTFRIEIGAVALLKTKLAVWALSALLQRAFIYQYYFECLCLTSGGQ